MLDQMIRDAFDQMAYADQPPGRVSVAQAIRQARIRRCRQLVTAVCAPVLVAAAALAVALSGALVAGVTASRPTPAVTGSRVAPKRFNPLVPYVAAGWYPFRASQSEIDSWPTVLSLSAGYGESRSAWANIVVYASGQCRLATSRLLCGAAADGTSAVLTLRGQVPDVGLRTAYWIGNAGGLLFLDGVGHDLRVAFQYARGGWAVVTSGDKPADAVRIARALRYGQTSPLLFPARVSGLPRAWREVQEVYYGQDGPRFASSVVLGSHPSGPAFMPPHSLNVSVELGERITPDCVRTCHATVINGYKVLLFKEPAQVFVPIADGLSLQVFVSGPTPQLSPADIFAHDLQLLGPSPAHWTTHPVG
jgi:hypothetical protein